MACTHTADCPLFPKLRESLGAWRTHYCDTEQAWRTCARFERSMRGEAVPLALLPNGKIVAMVAQDQEQAAARSATATATIEREQPDDVLPTVIKPSLWHRLFGRRDR